MKKIIILFSGKGTNLINLIEKVHGIHAQVVCAITNNPDAEGIQKTKHTGVHVEILDHRGYQTREEYDAVLVAKINEYHPDLVVLCGFMRILTNVFTKQVRAINLHPSLLPKFKGAKAIEQSYNSDDSICGVSVHWVSDELDGGEIILRKSFTKNPQDTLEEFSAKIREIEHEALPLSVIKILKD